MSTTTTRFTNQEASCGRVVDGERFRDWDEECVLSDELFYDGGCRSIRHEYHDGSVSHNVVRHDGKVLEDELIGEQ
ncbi:MAG: hypothetical protein O7I93_08520 [Gemmatimonadetes bacterium]|nr:hypothetical protein [Gemmatimonadota bacterium]